MTVGHSRANLVQPLGRPTAAQNRADLSARSARTVQTGPTAKRVRQLPGPTAKAVGPGSWRQTSLNGLNLAHSKPYGFSQFFHHLFRLGTSYKMSILYRVRYMRCTTGSFQHNTFKLVTAWALGVNPGTGCSGIPRRCTFRENYDLGVRISISIFFYCLNLASRAQFRQYRVS